MIVTITAMFSQQILDGLFFEPAFFYKMGILQRLADKREKIGSKPVGNREHETLFFTVENRGGEIIRCEFTHQVFGLVVLHFDIPWNLRQKLDQFMVKEWGTRFESVCHGHAVGQHQGMFRQARDKIGVQHAVEQVICFSVIEWLDDRRCGIPAPQFLPEILAIQAHVFLHA